MSFFRSFAQLRSLALVVGLLLLSLNTGSNPASAQDDTESLRPLINALADGKYKETEKQIGDLAATGNPVVAPALEALSDGDLYFRKSVTKG